MPDNLFNLDINPPNYGPPNMAAQLYSMLRGIPQAYQEGAKSAYERGQMARTEALQAPIDADLNTPEGIQSGLRELIRRGGGEYLEKLAPYLTQVQADRSLAQGPPGGPDLSPTADTNQYRQRHQTEKTSGGCQGPHWHRRLW